MESSPRPGRIGGEDGQPESDRQVVLFVKTDGPRRLYVVGSPAHCTFHSTLEQKAPLLEVAPILNWPAAQLDGHFLSLFLVLLLFLRICPRGIYWHRLPKERVGRNTNLCVGRHGSVTFLFVCVRLGELIFHNLLPRAAQQHCTSADAVRLSTDKVLVLRGFLLG